MLTTYSIQPRARQKYRSLEEKNNLVGGFVDISKNSAFEQGALSKLLFHIRIVYINDCMKVQEIGYKGVRIGSQFL